MSKQITSLKLLILVGMIILASCHHKLVPSKSADHNCKQTGQASYYADKFDGRKTANGEIFDQDKLTAAHKTLPFGTIVKVTNLTNNKTVIVRINDRGPFVAGRIIDLSKAAAKKIDLISAGVVKVTVVCQ